jgi:hypothetical protein
MGLEAILFVCAAMGVCIGCLVPNRWLPPLPNDKLLHFAAFAVLTVLALRIADSLAEGAWWLAGLLLGGWLIECLQALVPDRRFCWRDMAANAAGIAFAAVAVSIAGHPGLTGQSPLADTMGWTAQPPPSLVRD